MAEHPKSSLPPHVVLLGAGASRAAFPNGDKESRCIPLMDDLVEILDLNPVLDPVGPIENMNFESIYSKLVTEPSYERERREVERRVSDYFSSLELPKEPTIYDKLLLSLRPEDAIFTFNWDPFLFDARERNDGVVDLPGIFFLHGNVRIGACRKHPGKWGRRRVLLCPDCGELFDDVPLLYPVEQKGYSAAAPYIATAWKSARWFLKEAFVLTIFGYSAPPSDQDAVGLLKTAWMERSAREFEHVEVVDIAPPASLYERFGKFTPTHHLKTMRRFEESFAGRWPRRAKEKLSLATFEGTPSFNRPLADTDDLTELQAQVREIAKSELNEV